MQKYYALPLDSLTQLFDIGTVIQLEVVSTGREGSFPS